MHPPLPDNPPGCAGKWRPGPWPRSNHRLNGGRIEWSMNTRRPVLVERAALVGLVTGGARRVDAEHSLEELGGLAEAAGARVVLRVLQDRPKPDSATFLGSGKVDVLAPGGIGSRRRSRHLRQRTVAGAAARAGQAARSQGGRSHAADSRHLCPSRADARRQAAGRARAAEIHAPAVGRRRPGAVAPRRRHRHQGPWRNQTRSRSAPHSRAHEDLAGRDRRRPPASLAIARAAAQGRCADGGARRLYQRRKDHVVQPVDASSDAEASNALFVTLDPLVRRVSTCPIDANCCSATRSDSSIGCRTPWWRHFAPRSRKPRMRTSCCTSLTRPIPNANAMWPR